MLGLRGGYIDNVFVWAIIFTYFAVPRGYQHRVLFYGVIGALVFRAVFIAAGSTLIASFSWILYVFAAFLLYTGYRMLRTRDDHVNPAESRTYLLFRRFVPMVDEYRGRRFVVKQAGKWVATPLLAVLVIVEVTDIVFAVDSIPAIFAVTSEPFLVFTANAFAILGLRAMYFLLADLIHRFIYLKAGLALVLMWVGVKMLLKIDVFYIPTTISLAVVATIISVSIGLSLRATRGQGRRPADQVAGPFTVLDEARPAVDRRARATEEVVTEIDRTGRLARLVDSDRFNGVIAAVIVANAVVLGLETYPGVMAEHETLLVLPERVLLPGLRRRAGPAVRLVRTPAAGLLQEWLERLRPRDHRRGSHPDGP